MTKTLLFLVLTISACGDAVYTGPAWVDAGTGSGSGSNASAGSNANLAPDSTGSDAAIEAPETAQR